MLWIKSFHIIFVTAWFAGLFYLPRIFVNLAMVPAPGPERDRLLLMGGKLYRFMTLLGVVAIVFGLWLWLLYRIGAGAGWMHAKLTLVLLLIAYHGWCGKLLADFQHGRNRHSHVWYRVFNEVPVLLLTAIVLLVVLKPF
ncbi:MAG: CopD family protein [Sutterellaceae bacterium]|nr:CopD family protein [Burkholderiaceae bacterium]MDW8429464.1 CopD family protein [Sutterellaceae bacterium]